MRRIPRRGNAAAVACLLLIVPPAGDAGRPASNRSAPFAPPVSIALGAGREPECLAAGDFDEDGRTDLLVGGGGANDVTVLLGDGRGAFRVGRSFPAGPNPSEIFVADFNGDHHLDVAIANHESPHVTILLGDGRGAFVPGPGSPLTVRSRPHPHTVTGCDADGDGVLDLVIDSWGENRLTLLHGDGHGGFATPGTPIEVGRKPYRNVIARDLDGDGRCDLVTPTYDGGVATVLIGDGHGGFRAGPGIPAGPAPFVVAVADFNDDGRLDLAFADYSGRLSDPSGDGLTFLLADRRGGFRPGPRLPTGGAPFHISAGDVDGDGVADAVTADHSGSDLTVAFGGYPSGLSAQRVTRVPLPATPDRVLLVDVNGDARADAVVACRESRAILVLLAK